MTRPRMRMSTTVLGSEDPRGLADFYQRLLGWQRTSDEPEWVLLRANDDKGIAFQLEPDHVPPVWPPKPGEQQMMMHLDIGVENLDDGVDWAVGVGARLADHQPQEDVRVMVDPAGHHFCLFPDPHLG